MASSVEFSWNPDDFLGLIELCDFDDGVIESMKWIHSPSDQILEAGCGLGRVVKYIYDKGYKNVKGIELNEAGVKWVNENFPELDIIQGDVLEMPYEEDFFDVILSYGVVEHFRKGLHEPLLAHYRILKPGGVVVFTVPSANVIRSISYWWALNKHLFNPKMNPFIRRLFGKKAVNVNAEFDEYLYMKFPTHGKFFEYRFRPAQFKKALRKAGYKILKSKPISHIDGLYHIFGSPLILWENQKFTVSRKGKIINFIFSLIPYFHNHMQLCVAQKPIEKK